MNNISADFSNLEKAILKTLAFFDIFDYPLTLVEIYKWLYQPDKSYQLFEISQALASPNLGKIIAAEKSFYFLAGHRSLVNTRLERYQIAEKKFKIAKKLIFWLRWLVFVEMIAVCNNAAYSNAEPKSDVDFFIIVRRGRLWWSRLAVTLTATLLRLRRHGQKTTDRVCLSFYLADSHLNLADISLKPVDPYLIYWLATLAPIYDLGIYQKFIATNVWLTDYLPNFYGSALNQRRLVADNSYLKFSKGLDRLILGGLIGDGLEKLAFLVQSARVKRYLGLAINQSDTKVVISQAMLKFHKTDRRSLYRELWRQKTKSLGIL